jgi:bloom syndrome protein
VPIMALTATATKNTLHDIKQSLRLAADCAVFQQSFNRPNLQYNVLLKGSKSSTQDHIASYIHRYHPEKSGIVYCCSKKTCEEVDKSLRDQGIKSAYYHASLPVAEKDRVMAEWDAGQIQVVVATVSAFQSRSSHVLMWTRLHLGWG